ncbi:DUF3054 domain-containing protein [Intrasporangium sp.]|uniref:DUF3054 domain-containing protein n=1 Tax=Intrasporangium sp. TaxID=1925024 RepID=UPI00293B0F24|nr:DUF3054 domain-containing protein [Intrasporangium sp.]MDV3223191.1 DUF3054 domain-containing protein [Intrasporangium sp.]
MTPPASLRRRPVVGFVVDALLVVAFAAIGRASHDESLSLGGVLATASPFLVGTAMGWLVVHSRRGAWPLEVGPGITVWFSTLVIGMLLRVALQVGFAWAFLAVAAGVLAAFLVGWRALVSRVGTRGTRE